MATKPQGFSDVAIGGKGWRVFSGWDSQRRFLVQVAERDEARREIAGGVARNLLVPLGAALPLLAGFVWFGIRRALRPLNALGKQVRERRPDSLSALEEEGIPAEVVPLVESLNGLFERVSRLIESERRFTADAAHELRTPLAALKTQAQVARGAREEGTRQRALEAVIAGCDRMTHLVEQLLTLARLESAQASSGAAFDLYALSQQAAGELAPSAAAHGIDLELAGEGPAEAQGQPGLVSVLLRNLLDNAVRYSPSGTTVRVDVKAGEAPSVSVVDQGPGIPPEERAKVGERFYRILGSGQTGSGLGLSIVRRIAEIHGATLLLEDGPGGRGLRATVSFPEKARTP